ncbi:MAG: hypothetical protein QOH70_2154 [Blastocatellia bacterium]|nr:hypothetical protein [Blastocatellia bacterium]
MSPGDRPVSLPNPPAILTFPEWRERAVYLVGAGLTWEAGVQSADFSRALRGGGARLESVL